MNENQVEKPAVKSAERDWTTYREYVQDELAAIERRYDNAGFLRDNATEEEKRYWNDIRSLLRQVSTYYRQLDDSLPEWSAKTKLPGRGGL